jgi:hypothetical protein
LVLFSDPLVDVGIFTASSNATQPHALPRNFYQRAWLGNHEYQQIANMENQSFVREGCSRKGKLLTRRGC